MSKEKKGCGVITLAGAICAGLSCTDDFTDRTIIYAVTYGNRRFHILLVKGCRYILGCTAIIISYMAVFMIVSLPVLETGISLSDLAVYCFFLIYSRISPDRFIACV